MSILRAFIEKLITYIIPRVQWLVLVAGILIPAVIITLYPNLYHSSDVDDLWRWSRSWDADWKSIYLDCSRCNYPFLGTFVSAGIMSMSGIDNFHDIVMPFRYYLGIIDGVNILLIYWILSKFQVKGAPLWAGIIGLLPSSWIGSSIWGQIDGIGLMLILLTFVLSISFNFKEKTSFARYYLFIFTTGLLISLMILFKQLIVFSLISVGFMSVMNIFLYSQKINGLLTSFLLMLFSIAMPIILIDSTLHLRPPFISHLQYIWETGSHHGDIISSFGFNIWIFLSKNPFGSSHEVINIGITPDYSIPLIPYNLGIALFLISVTFFSAFFLQYIIRKFRRGTRFFDRETILGFLFHLSLVNLSFNLFLTGTHERYLFYFYPFLIMAYLGLENYSALFNRKLLYLLFAGAASYGLVLYVYLIGAIKNYGWVPFQASSIFHVCLFVYLSILFTSYFKPNKVERNA
jgi:hypothetical protein